jgi:hypothetical protein
MNECEKSFRREFFFHSVHFWSLQRVDQKKKSGVEKIICLLDRKKCKGNRAFVIRKEFKHEFFEGFWIFEGTDFVVFLKKKF